MGRSAMVIAKVSPFFTTATAGNTHKTVYIRAVSGLKQNFQKAS